MTAVRDRSTGAEHRGRRRPDRRKMLALVSAFTVLGVGAGVTTLASWSEGIPLLGTNVGASSFCVEYSLNGTSWVTETVSSGTPATISMSFPNGATLSPTSAAYGLLAVAVCPGSTVGAVMSIAPVGGQTSGLLGALNYGVNSVSSAANCSAANFSSGTPILPTTTTLSSSTANSTSVPVAGGTSSAPTGFVPLCFQVNLPSAANANVTSLQGVTATPGWTLTVTSTS